MLEEGVLMTERAAAFTAAVVDSVAALAEIDAPTTATLILQHFPEEHLHVVQSLQDTLQLQFNYLQAADQVCGALRALQSWITVYMLDQQLVLLMAWQSLDLPLHSVRDRWTLGCIASFLASLS